MKKQNEAESVKDGGEEKVYLNSNTNFFTYPSIITQ